MDMTADRVILHGDPKHPDDRSWTFTRDKVGRNILIFVIQQRVRIVAEVTGFVGKT